MTFKTIFAAAALVTSLGVSIAPVQAQDMIVLHERVRFDDLDVTHAAGARVVLQRIHTASTRVCGPNESPRDIAMWTERRRCMADSVRNAVAEVGSPIVTAMYEGHATPRAYELAMTSATPPVR